MDWAIFAVILQAIIDAINEKGDGTTRQCLRRGGGRIKTLRDIKKEIGEEEFRANRQEIISMVFSRLSAADVDFLMAEAQAAE
jgi:hypothetical protein